MLACSGYFLTLCSPHVNFIYPVNLAFLFLLFVSFALRYAPFVLHFTMLSMAGDVIFCNTLCCLWKRNALSNLDK